VTERFGADGLTPYSGYRLYTPRVMGGITLDKQTVEQLADFVGALRAHQFESLTEAAVFCVAATATMNSQFVSVSDIGRALNLPMSTVSRMIWELSQRGLLAYKANTKDRRSKLVRANLDAFSIGYRDN